MLNAVRFVALFDADGLLVYSNPACRRELGWLAESVPERRRYRRLMAELGLPPASVSTASPGWEGDLELLLWDGRDHPLRVSQRRLEDGGALWVGSPAEAATPVEPVPVRLEPDAAAAMPPQLLEALVLELRKRLNAMLGFAQLAQRDAREPLPPRQLQRARHIIDDGQQLVQLLDDVLELTLLDTNRIEPSPARVDALTLVERVRARPEHSAARALVRLHVMSTSERLEIESDPIWLGRVVYNLGANAIAFNRPGGSVVFSLSVPRAGVMRINVADTGGGIAHAHQARIFEPLYRAGSGREGASGGGMGLPLALRLVERLRGRLGFRSSSSGSEFWVDVPAPDTDASEP